MLETWTRPNVPTRVTQLPAMVQQGPNGFKTGIAELWTMLLNWSNPWACLSCRLTEPFQMHETIKVLNAFNKVVVQLQLAQIDKRPQIVNPEHV